MKENFGPLCPLRKGGEATLWDATYARRVDPVLIPLGVVALCGFVLLLVIILIPPER